MLGRRYEQKTRFHRTKIGKNILLRLTRNSTFFSIFNSLIIFFRNWQNCWNTNMDTSIYITSQKTSITQWLKPVMKMKNSNFCFIPKSNILFCLSVIFPFVENYSTRRRKKIASMLTCYLSVNTVSSSMCISILIWSHFTKLRTEFHFIVKLSTYNT